MLHLMRSTLRVGTVRKFSVSGLSTVDSQDRGFIYDPVNLMEKSDKYFHDREIGQCCEKAFRASELTLTNYVKQLEQIFNVKIAEEGNESWNRFMLDKLVTKLAKHFVTQVEADLFRGRWNTAIRFHIEGLVNNLGQTQEIADSLAKDLFLKPELVATQLKQICADFPNASNDLEKSVIISKAIQSLRVNTTLRKKHVGNQSEIERMRANRIHAKMKIGFDIINTGPYLSLIKVECPSFIESISDEIGDFVKTDDIVAEIETDKTSVEVPAPFPGTIVEFLVEDGAKVAARQKLYKLEKGEAKAGGAEAKKPAEAPPPKAAPPPPPEPNREEAKPTESAIPTKLPPIPELPKEPMSSKPVADIKPYKVTAPPSIAQAAPGAAEQQPQPGARTETRVKMNRMRLRIAERLKEAQNTNAMLTTFNEVDLFNVMQMRKKYQESFTKKHYVKLGLMSPFVRASAIALQDQPGVNAVIEGTEIVYRNYVDISIAVATPRGLVVPVLRNVESMSYSQIEKMLGELGVKARDNKLAIEDMQGGTFTISNGGVFGSMMGTPIINPPQSAILGMHGIFDRPVAVEGKVEIRPMMYVALTYDHRLIDGREAVTFLRKIKQAVEDPLTILLDL